MRRSFFLYLLLLPVAISGYSQDSIWLARTTGQLPYMDYGIGADRLGGAKIGYLDSNIVVSVVDSFAAEYKVRLSANHSAYIAKTALTLLGKSANRPLANNPHLTGSIKVYGDTASDYVSIGLDDRYPYRSFQLLDPSRIAIDIFGVTSNTNWINQLRTAKEVRNTWYEQVEDDVFRVYIQLRHAQHWGYGIAYDISGKKLTVSAHAFSATARGKIEAAGGVCELVVSRTAGTSSA